MTSKKPHIAIPLFRPSRFSPQQAIDWLRRWAGESYWTDGGPRGNTLAIQSFERTVAMLDEALALLRKAWTAQTADERAAWRASVDAFLRRFDEGGVT